MQMAKAGHPSPLTETKRRALFGSFTHKKNPNQYGGVIILGGWVGKNIVTVNVPQLAGTPTYGGDCSGKIRFHKKAAAQLKAAWQEIEDAGLLGRVLQWGGSFVARHICWKPKNRLSSHSWGIAFDINVPWNGYGATPPAAGEHGSIRELVPILEAWGFAWGGWFGTPDGMHFEAYLADLDEPQRPRLKINGELVEGVRLEMRANTNHGVLGPMAKAIGDTANQKSRVMMPVAEYLRSRGYAVKWAPKEGPKGTVIATK